MKARSVFKRRIALLLVVVMLFSCWVFTATQSNSATAGSYTVAIDAICENDADCGSSYIKVWYKDNNGTGTDHQGEQKWSRDDNYTWDGTGSDDQTFTISGFPYKVEYKVYKRSGAYAMGKIKGHFNISVQGVGLGSSNTIEGNSGDMYMTWNWTESSHKPYAKYIDSFGLASGQSATLTNPTGNNTVTKTISMGTVKDQYGVNWYQDPAAYVVSGAGYSVSGSTVTIGSGALATASNWKTTGVIGVKAGSTVLKNGINSNTNATVTFTGTNPTYTTTWKWHNNGDSSTTWSGSTTKENVYYNENPSAPAAATTTTSYYDADKHYSDGKYNTSAITGAKTFYMTYPTSEAHSYTYSPIASNDTNHTASCACGYNKAVEHTYGKYSDNGNGTHSRTCGGTTGCGYVETKAHTWGAWQIIPDGQSANYGGHDRMAKHYRVCTADGCGAKDYDNHTWVAQTIQAPTCTTDGHTPYKCSQCQLTTVDLNTDGDHIEDFQPMLGHDFQYNPSGTKTDTQHQEKCSRCTATQMVNHPGYGDWYSVDGTYHAHNCTVCDKQVKFTHKGNWSGWQHEAPKADETGVRATVRETLSEDAYNHDKQCFNYCSVCAQVEYQNHTETSEVTTPATCTEKGITTYTCSACGNARTDTNIPALGHAFVQQTVEPGDDAEGYECFTCSNCKKYWAATYDEGAQEYVPLTEDPETHEAISGASEASNVKDGSDQVPAPYFNNYSTDASKEGFDYNYSYRDSSLKLMKDAYTDTNTRQDFRFSGAVTIPAGISYKVNNPDVTDNVITDFGFIYTQDSYGGVYGAGKLTLANVAKDNHYAKMSVVDNNAGSAFDGSNWSGVTYHKNGDIETLTFNLVISMKAKNWKMQYAARPYITYKYRGVEYTVYDGGASSDQQSELAITYSFGSVYAIAAASISTNKDITSDVVFNYVKKRIIANRDALGTDAATDWWRWFNEYETFEENDQDPNSSYNQYKNALNA